MSSSPGPALTGYDQEKDVRKRLKEYENHGYDPYLNDDPDLGVKRVDGYRPVPDSSGTREPFKSNRSNLPPRQDAVVSDGPGYEIEYPPASSYVSEEKKRRLQLDARATGRKLHLVDIQDVGERDFLSSLRVEDLPGPEGTGPRGRDRRNPGGNDLHDPGRRVRDRLGLKNKSGYPGDPCGKSGPGDRVRAELDLVRFRDRTYNKLKWATDREARALYDRVLLEERRTRSVSARLALENAVYPRDGNGPISRPRI